MKVLDLFSGIGGFSLGLERAGMETVAFCEIEPFCQKVLRKHWPDVPIYDDVRELTKERLNADGIFPDIITGGFPCQDISVAGKQTGIDGERSGLWSECARLLGDIRPRYAIFENVTALLSGDNGKWFERVLWDISQVGYDAEWHCIPASELGAHHHRDRVWIICYPQHTRWDATEVREGNQKGNGSHKEGKEPTSEFTGSSDAEVLAYSQSVGDKKQRCTLDRKNATAPEGARVANKLCPVAGRGLSTILADTASQRLLYRKNEDGRENQKRVITRRIFTRDTWSVEPDVGRVVDGLSAVLDRSSRIKALGNAVVPQIPELIGRAIMESA